MWEPCHTLPLKNGSLEYTAESAVESAVERTRKLTIEAQSKVYDGKVKPTTRVHRVAEENVYQTPLKSRVRRPLL